MNFPPFTHLATWCLTSHTAIYGHPFGFREIKMSAPVRGLTVFYGLYSLGIINDIKLYSNMIFHELLGNKNARIEYLLHINELDFSARNTYKIIKAFERMEDYDTAEKFAVVCLDNKYYDEINIKNSTKSVEFYKISYEYYPDRISAFNLAFVYNELKDYKNAERYLKLCQEFFELPYQKAVKARCIKMLKSYQNDQSIRAELMGEVTEGDAMNFSSQPIRAELMGAAIDGYA